MATARRVKQDGKSETTHEPFRVETFRVVVNNGRETSREPIGAAATGTIQGRRYVAQSDRIHLDLSVEEAETVRGIMGAIGGRGHRRTHSSAVRGALEAAGIRTSMYDIGVTGQLDFKDVSPTTGTQASSVKDASPVTQCKSNHPLYSGGLCR